MICYGGWNIKYSVKWYQLSNNPSYVNMKW